MIPSSSVDSDEKDTSGAMETAATKEEQVSEGQQSPVQNNGCSVTEYEPDKEKEMSGYQQTPVYTNGSIPSELELETSKDAPQPPEMSKRRIMKNVLVISFFFFLNFISYGGLAALQSSLHLDEGMGVITSAIGFSSLALSCLLLPKIAIRVLGYKWCMSVSLIGYLLWMAANGYAVWATMIPASIICGICGATLWTTQGAYFALVAKHYARQTGQDPKAVTAFFFGISYAFFRTTAVFGSIISSTILSQRPENVTEPTDAELDQWCGLNDCPNSGKNNTNMSEPSSTTLWTLVGVYIGIGVLAFIISCVFVDNIPAAWAAEDQQASTSTAKMVASSLLATIKHMRYVRLLLLIPLTVYTGMEQTFREAEYTKSFVSCYLGMWMIGWCLIPSAIVNAIVSILGGRVMKYTGIFPMFVFAFCVDLTYQLILMFWDPSKDEEVFFFIVPCINTLADAIWLAQMSALYGILFPTTFAAAFSNYNFWKAVGNILEFSYSSYLCTSVKLYILMGFLCVGMLFLIAVYVVYMRAPSWKKNKKGNSISSNETETKRDIFTITPRYEDTCNNSLSPSTTSETSSGEKYSSDF